MGESAAKYRAELDLDEFERRLRASAPSQQAGQPNASAPDPLAELARLVSGAGERREDPFEALFRAQRAVTEGAQPPLQAPREPYTPGPAAYPGPARFAPEPEPQWVEEPSRVDAPWASQAPEFAPEPQAFPTHSAQRGNRRRIVYAMAALLVGGVALFAGGLALKKGSSGLPPVIQADSDPARIKPPGQDAAANSVGQALFDGKSDSAPAKVVSKTEQPADLAVAARQAEAQTRTQTETLAGAAAIATPAPPQPSPAASPPQAGAAALMPPRKVKTVSIRADGSLLDAPGSGKPPSSALPTLAAGGPDIGSIAPAAGTAAPRTPSAAEAAPQHKARHEAKRETKPETKPETHASAAEPAAPGDWAVQLAGEPSEADARAAASRYASKYGASLQGRHPTFVAAKIGEKTIYRVRVGRLSKPSAQGMCAAIKTQGGACFIVRN